jgi:hypothetical protein
LTPAELLSLFRDCAERAERLGAAGAEVVFVTGVELSIMNRGFVEGTSVDERLGRLLPESSAGPNGWPRSEPGSASSFARRSLSFASGSVGASPTPPFRSRASSGTSSTSSPSS